MRTILSTLLIFLALPFDGLSQSCSGSEIIERAEKMLFSILGDSVRNHIALDTNSTYVYRNALGIKRTRQLSSSIETRGKLFSAEIRWKFALPHSACVAMDTIRGWTGLSLDHNLNPTSNLDLEFVPDFYLNKTDCGLITKEVALEIAIGDSIRMGIEPLEMKLNFLRTHDIFQWYILSTISRETDSKGLLIGEREEVFIDARTGNVRGHYVTTSRQIY